jgi:Capsule polysaccharide biosynthesis protein
MTYDSRRTIVVEARKDPRAAVMLDAMANVCFDLGYNVERWRGPLSGRMPYSRWLPVCDLAILFNGAHHAYRPALARLHAWGAATLFVELGWYPQAGHFQIDAQGVNAAASWSHTPLTHKPQVPLKLRTAGDLLLLLQLDEDTQITERSPWFANMQELVQHVVTHSALPVRVRSHPLAKIATSLKDFVTSQGATWDTTATLANSLKAARAVACINSSSAVEAMAQQLPVLCYGDAVYRHAGAVYCMTNKEATTQQVTQELAKGYCSLFANAQQEIVRRIQDNQWTVTQLTERLPPLVGQLLSQTLPVKPQLTASFLMEQALSWVSDLPAAILYRKRLRASA